MNFRRSAVTFALLLVTSGYTYAQLPPYDSYYELIFSDEFEKPWGREVVDPSKWSRTPGWNQPSNFTGNVSYCYVPDTTTRKWDKAYIVRDPNDSSTVRIRNGVLQLVTKKERRHGETWTWPDGKTLKKDYPEFNYVTGMLYSKPRFRYGYFEIRFRLPGPPPAPYTYQGFGPNFWIFNRNPEQGNYYSEIDVFEIDATDNTYTCNAHYRDTDEPGTLSRTFYYWNKLEPGRWYTAAVWWTPKYIKYLLDDVVIHRFPCSATGVEPDMLTEMPIFIDVNAPATNFCKNFDPVNTWFPYIYEIDYVRVYREKDEKGLRRPFMTRLRRGIFGK